MPKPIYMAPPRRRSYLRSKKMSIITRLRVLLECLAEQDLATLTPESRARLAAALDLMPGEIPTGLVARLRRDLREVA
jgi:hypothetical protein